LGAATPANRWEPEVAARTDYTAAVLCRRLILGTRLMRIACILMTTTGCSHRNSDPRADPVDELVNLSSALQTFYRSEERWPATTAELEAFCARNELPSSASRRVQLIPEPTGSLIMVWRRDDYVLAARWNWAEDAPTIQALSPKEFRRIVRSNPPTDRRSESHPVGAAPT
jgi:hypothetical protein